MFYLLLLFGSIKQILCQFAPHMDLQKIDEIMFDNTKYSVLKPTIHITRDHFKDFIQQKVDKDFPGKKLYVDRNGIRHYWHGFEARGPKSLRKAIVEINDIPVKEGKTSTGKTTITINEQGNKLSDNKEVKFNITKKTEVSKKVKNKPQRKKKINEPVDDIPISEKDKLALRKNEGKTKVKSTFFCPFFGVVTMISYID